MEGVLNKEKESVETKIKGECGHDQKLVGYRPKKMLTLFGEVEWKRPYYHCQADKENEEVHVEVYGDRGRTRQVLSNLLTNAIKYSPPTEPIWVSAIADEHLVTIRVQDQGKGVPQDQQVRIFECFYRISDTNQERVPGLGLGLYLAAEIMKRQGGRIWVESTPGGGATFFFTVPLAP